MRFISFSAILVTICVLTAAGHGFGHGGGHAEEVSYTVATAYEHGGDDGGHDGGEELSYDGGYDAGSYGGHDAGSYGGHGGGHDSGHNGGHDGGHDDGHDHHAYPKYEFDYGVKDTKTGDIKSHSESRDGDKVKGSYTFKEADGTTRHVEYSSNKKDGFTAVVHKLGQANADQGSHGAGHGHGHHGHGDHGHASSFVVVKKQEESKH